MKKLIVIAAALLAGMQANAQLIFNGGYLHQTEKTVIQGDNATLSGVDALDGFYAGAKYRIALEGITEGLSIAPGANFSFLFGRHTALNGDGFKEDIIDNMARMNQIAFNVPVHVQYCYEVTPDFKLEAWAGPTFQLGLFDNIVDSDDNPSLLFERFKMIDPAGTFGEMICSVLAANYRTQAALNRFNVLLGIGVGVEVAELIHVNVGYDFGLLNLSTSASTKVSRGLLRVGLGYNF